MIDPLAQLYMLRSLTPGRSCPRGRPGTISWKEHPLMTDANKRTARTVLQTAVGVAVALPAIVAASGIPEALPWVAGALAVSGGFARVMALPSVQALLPSWLRTETPRR